MSEVFSTKCFTSTVVPIVRHLQVTETLTVVQRRGRPALQFVRHPFGGAHAQSRPRLVALGASICYSRSARLT